MLAEVWEQVQGVLGVAPVDTQVLLHGQGHEHRALLGDQAEPGTGPAVQGNLRGRTVEMHLAPECT